MKEKDLQSMFGNWLKANKKITAGWELKICKTNRFSLSNIASHQISNLELTNKDLLYYKFPDLGLQNIYDCVSLYKESAYVVIFYYQPRKPKNFYAINITAIIGLIDDGKKSLTEEDANKYCEFKGVLK